MPDSHPGEQRVERTALSHPPLFPDCRASRSANLRRSEHSRVFLGGGRFVLFGGIPALAAANSVLQMTTLARSWDVIRIVSVFVGFPPFYFFFVLPFRYLDSSPRFLRLDGSRNRSLLPIRGQFQSAGRDEDPRILRCNP